MVATLIGILAGLALIVIDELWLEPLILRRRIDRALRALMFLSPHPRRPGPIAAAGHGGARTTPAGSPPVAARPPTSVGAGRLPHTSAPTGSDLTKWDWS